MPVPVRPAGSSPARRSRGWPVWLGALVLLALASAPAPAAVRGPQSGPTATSAAVGDAPRVVSASAAALDARHAEAVAAYRASDPATARALWESLARESLPEAARAQLYENLGNAAWRLGEPLSAVAWFTSAARLAPRRLELWSDLEFARREAGLPPADRGDLRSTATRLAGLVTPRESGALLLAGLALLGLVLFGEALRGGLFWRRLTLGAFFLAALAAGPWAWHVFVVPAAPVMVVSSEPEPLVSEPREDLSPLASLEPGDLAARLDSLPGWVRVETASGVRGWVPEGTVQALGR